MPIVRTWRRSMSVQSAVQMLCPLVYGKLQLANCQDTFNLLMLGMQTIWDVICMLSTI